MIDAIGLGSFLFNLGIILAFVAFAVVTLLSRFVLKRRWLTSVLVGLPFSVIGLFSSPYVFIFFLKLNGISF